MFVFGYILSEKKFVSLLDINFTTSLQIKNNELGVTSRYLNMLAYTKSVPIVYTHIVFI